jgi:hypothetical protein
MGWLLDRWLPSKVRYLRSCFTVPTDALDRHDFSRSLEE